MAYAISVKENIDAFIIKQRLVSKINMLPEKEAHFMVSQLAILIDKSLNQGETIDDKNVDKNFVTFLLRLFY